VLFVFHLIFTGNISVIHIILFLFTAGLSALSFAASRSDRPEVRHTPKNYVTAAVFLIMIGALNFVFDNVLILGMSWLARLPFLLLIVAGALTVIILLLDKKASGTTGSQYRDQI
jgi:hypothetical protein